jgi:hypothetical protein
MSKIFNGSQKIAILKGFFFSQPLTHTGKLYPEKWCGAERKGNMTI